MQHTTHNFLSTSSYSLLRTYCYHTNSTTADNSTTTTRADISSFALLLVSLPLHRRRRSPRSFQFVSNSKLDATCEDEETERRGQRRGQPRATRVVPRAPRPAHASARSLPRKARAPPSRCPCRDDDDDDLCSPLFSNASSRRK